MKTSLCFTILLGTVLMISPSFAQNKPASAETTPLVATSPVAAPSGMPNEAEMMKQMAELAKLNENHKLLASMNGNWSYVVKMWMDGNTSAKPMEWKGTAVRKSVMEGRYIEMDATSKIQMPGADGKPKDMNFKGHGMEGYDNVKKKFVGTWMDNMGTGIMTSEGDYDPATKTFTYTGELEAMPGMKQKIREVMKLTDKDHLVFEWYETRGPQEMKTMEIDYTRSGKK